MTHLAVRTKTIKTSYREVKEDGEIVTKIKNVTEHEEWLEVDDPVVAENMLAKARGNETFLGLDYYKIVYKGNIPRLVKT